jgi:hypothetical protein
MRWGKEATALFNRLWAARGYDESWKYDDFRRVWPTATQQECDQKRFWNKLHIEAGKRLNRSTPAAADAGQKGRKRKRTQKALEAEASGPTRQRKRNVE